MQFSYSQSILLTYPKLENASKALNIMSEKLCETATDNAKWAKNLEPATTYTLLLLDSGLMEEDKVIRKFAEYAFPKDKPEEITLRIDIILDFIAGKLSSPHYLNLLLNIEELKMRIQDEDHPENHIADMLLSSNVTLRKLQSGVRWKLPSRASFIAVKKVCDGENPYTKTLAENVMACTKEEKVLLHEYAMKKMQDNNIDTTLFRCFNTMVKKCEFEQIMIKKDEILRTIAALTVTDEVLARYINRIRSLDNLKTIINLFNTSPMTLMQNPSLSEGGRAKILQQMNL